MRMEKSKHNTRQVAGPLAIPPKVLDVPGNGRYRLFNLAFDDAFKPSLRAPKHGLPTASRAPLGPRAVPVHRPKGRCRHS